MIGRSAKEPHFQGGGSSHINPTQVDIPFDELQKLAGDAELTYCDGYPATPDFQQPLIDEAVAAAQAADVALLFVALPSFIESEGYDRADLDLTRQQVALIQAVSAAQPNTVVILNNGSALTMGEWIDWPGRGPRSLDDGPGRRRRHRRCALRQSEPVGQAGRNLPTEAG